MSKGRQGLAKWKTTRKKWIEKNPPDKNGNYECWLCHRPVHADKMTLDHVADWATYPEYRYELSNLKPSHDWCNNERHSQTLKRLRGRKIIGTKRKK